jgi:hypothetical protein
MNTTSNDPNDMYPNTRTYRLDLKRCMIRTCDGELAEVSYYERNNWVAIEYKCNRCNTEFTVKVEI